MAKTAKTQTYKQLLTRTDAEIETDQLELSIEIAKNTLSMGKSSVHGQMLTADSEVKKAQAKVAEAQRNLLTAKGANPFSVQGILNARTALKQAELEVETKKENYNELKEAFDYLETLAVELF